MSDRLRRAIIISSEGVEEMMIAAPESCVARHRVKSLREMHEVLMQLEPEPGVSTLDLVGHSTRDTRMLRIGKTVVDMADARVASFFAMLRQELVRLGIEEVRVLGCETACTEAGQRTLRALARTLGVRVLGSRKPLMKTHYSADGFSPTFANVLVSTPVE